MIKSIKEQSGAQVDIDQRGEGPRQVIIKGTRAQTQLARDLVDDVVWKSIDWERKEQEKKEPWKKMAKDTRSRGLATSLLGSGTQGLRPAWVKDKEVSPDDGLMYSRAVMLAARKKLLTGKAYPVPDAVVNISIGDRPRVRMTRTMTGKIRRSGRFLPQQVFTTANRLRSIKTARPTRGSTSDCADWLGRLLRCVRGCEDGWGSVREAGESAGGLTRLRSLRLTSAQE